MLAKGLCPIWNTAADLGSGTADGFLVESDRAGGTYFLTRSAKRRVEHLDDLQKAKLTTWIVDQHSVGVEVPEISSDTLATVSSSPQLAVVARADRLLRFLGKHSSHIGDDVGFSFDEGLGLQAFAWTESTEPNELDYLLAVLHGRLHISYTDTGHSGYATILVDGYIHLDELNRRDTASKQGFVAMWFDESMTEIYESGLAKGIRDAGYSPMRIDRKHHNNKIDDEIIAEIRRSRFLVADFTFGDSGPRGGVYYEAGFAYGLNIPVIFAVRSDMIGQTHFDTRQYAHILWTDASDLRKQLADRISATLGDGPLKFAESQQ